MSEKHQDIGKPARTLGIILLAGITGILLLGLVFQWVIFWRVRNYSDASAIDDVERAAWSTPVFWLGIVILCLPWIIIWRKREWDFGCFPVIITVVALLISAFFLVRVVTAERSLSITIWTCDPGEYSPFSSTSGRIPDGCEQSTSPATITFGTADDPDMYTANAVGDARLKASGLPEGYYQTRTTVTAPLETASIILVGERQLSPREPSTLRVDDSSAGEGRTWSVTSRLPSRFDSLALLYYPSAQPEQENATITFEVQECSGTPATLDPADCTPIQMDAPLMSVYGPPDDLQHHREPIVSREGSTMTWENLEARTYIFMPGSRGAFYFRQDNQFLAIPKEGPQTTDADELTRLDNGDEVLNIEISPESGTIVYMIYVFPTSPTTIAMTP